MLWPHSLTAKFGCLKTRSFSEGGLTRPLLRGWPVSDYTPPHRRGEPLGVGLAQVIGVGLLGSRQWSHDSLLVGIDIGQGRRSW